MPLPVYRKSTRVTPAYAEAETGTREKSFILKYEETTAPALEANFAIRHWTNFYEITFMLGMHQ